MTTNKPFAEWSEVFPNAACVVSLVDRLVHRAEVISIEGESYRLKEARERNEARIRQRKTRKPAAKKGPTSRAAHRCCLPGAGMACRSSCPTTGRPNRHWSRTNCSRICSP